ncbi:MAG TPA: tryptophan--tRNA ligase [Candidatus Binatia bacterium]|nr:tryptophan--tRNA ligase [Candidatus Binatia bacterium]
MTETEVATRHDPAAPPRRLRVLSGMQPTGRMHLGNYLGALRNWVGLQDRYDCVFFVADYHSLTIALDPGSIRPAIQDMVLDWLAAGIDPERSTVYLQSLLPEVTELHLLLSMATPLGWLERVPSYKEKAEQFPENINYGLLGYPVLQAADILLPRADRVPVGEDQAPHIELTREIARRFNSRFGQVFPEPQGLFTEMPRVMGTDGLTKMSKSRGNTIGMLDSPEQIRRTVMTMVTDVERPRRSDPGHPEHCNVCGLHRFFSPDRFEEIWQGEREARTGCVEVKRGLAEAIARYFAPMRERRAELESNPDTVWEVLAAGAERARGWARETLAMAREACGLPPAGRHR